MAALEGANSLASSRLVDLSEQNIIDCSGNCPFSTYSYKKLKKVLFNVLNYYNCRMAHIWHETIPLLLFDDLPFLYQFLMATMDAKEETCCMPSNT